MAAILVIDDDHKLQGIIKKILPAEKLGMIKVDSKDPSGFGSKPEFKGQGDLPLSFEEMVRKVIKVEVDTSPANNIHESIIGKVERALIGIVLEEEHGNQVRASKKLGINRNTLRKKMKDLQIIPRIVAH